MSDYLKLNWRYLTGAALIHVLFAGVFGLTMVNMQRTELRPVLAIQATIVDSSTLVTKAPAKPVSAPKPPEPEQPVVDTEAEAAAQRQKDEAAQREKEQEREKEKQQQEQQREREVKEQQVREQQDADRKRVADAEAKATADAKAKADADAKAKVEADRKRVADIERKQKEAADKRKAADDAASKASREAELRRQLAEEEGREQAVSSGLLNQYVAQLKQHIERQWNRPASARTGLECEVRVAQTPTGTVLSAQVTQCNGDAAVKQSIEAAVMRASPLPLPSDQRLFERNLVLKFKPDE